MATVTLDAVLNNGDGTYTLQFSEAITNLNPGSDTADPNVILFSPSLNNWEIATFNAAETGNDIVVAAAAFLNDCTLAAIMDQPIDLSAADLFDVVAPQTAIT